MNSSAQKLALAMAIAIGVVLGAALAVSGWAS